MTPLIQSLGPVMSWLLLLLLGIAFGGVLESAGFGNSRVLAAQFYFRNLTVLKVMFSAIITAMVLIYLSTGLGLASLDAMWINTTYLVPDIVGGLIMGVGFVIGGYCPGTSLVAMATLKIDGVLFVVGAFLGVFLFGETVGAFTPFWIAGKHEALTLQDFFGVPTGFVVVGVMLMAMGMFKGGELLEGKFALRPQAKLPLWAVGAYLAGALLVLTVGQPTVEQRWQQVAGEQQPRLDSRQVFIEPREIAKHLHDERIEVHLWDYRSQSHYNLIHIPDALRQTAEALDEASLAKWKQRPGNAVFFVFDDDEERAISEWKRLVALGLHNVYIADGGMRAWIGAFHHHVHLDVNEKQPYGYELDARGDQHPIANSAREWGLGKDAPTKVKLEIKAGPSGGGCG